MKSKIKLKKDSETIISENIFGLHVINAVLPEQKLIYTQWFHSDSIANY